MYLGTIPSNLVLNGLPNIAWPTTSHLQKSVGFGWIGTTNNLTGKHNISRLDFLLQTPNCQELTMKLIIPGSVFIGDQIKNGPNTGYQDWGDLQFIGQLGLGGAIQYQYPVSGPFSIQSPINTDLLHFGWYQSVGHTAHSLWVLDQD
jgi:hypothetical protein